MAVKQVSFPNCQKYMSMKKILIFLSFAFLCVFSFAATKNAKAVNDKCPFSGKTINSEQSVVFNVCCGNCAKKAAGDLKSFVGKAKADNKACPFSGKAAKKKVVVAFCCSKCKGKASS